LDLGILALGVVNVPMYSTLTLEQVEYIANDSQAKVIFVSNVKQLEKVRNNETDMPKLEKIVCFDMDKVEMGEEMISFDQV
jgi:long-chain acyl-CoA synthetase